MYCIIFCNIYMFLLASISSKISSSDIGTLKTVSYPSSFISSI